MPKTTSTTMAIDQNKQNFISLCKQFIETGNEEILASITSNEAFKTIIPALETSFFFEIINKKFIDAIEANFDPIASLQTLFNYLFPLVKDKVSFFLLDFDKKNDTLLHAVLRLNSVRFFDSYVQALETIYQNFSMDTSNAGCIDSLIIRAYFMHKSDLVSAKNSAFFEAILTGNSELVQVFLAKLKRIKLYEEDFCQKNKQGKNLLMIIAHVGDIKLLTTVKAFLINIFGKQQAELLLKELSLDPKIIPSENMAINQQIEKFQKYQTISSASTATACSQEIHDLYMTEMGGCNDDSDVQRIDPGEAFTALAIKKQQAEDEIELFKQKIEAWNIDQNSQQDIDSSMKKIKGFYSFLYENDAAKKFQAEILNKLTAEAPVVKAVPKNGKSKLTSNPYSKFKPSKGKADDGDQDSEYEDSEHEDSDQEDSDYSENCVSDAETDTTSSYHTRSKSTRIATRSRTRHKAPPQKKPKLR